MTELVAGLNDCFAAIDIGTNSMHLVVARADPDGGFEVLTTEKEMTRLGRGGGEMRELSPEAMERGLSALDRMVRVARSFGEVDLEVVATSAVREAGNRQEFLDRAAAEIGVDVNIISGVEEARLIHLGVLQALPVYDKRILLIDIGGGSTEFLIGKGASVIEARSMKLGAIRLTERFFLDGSTSTKSVDKCRHHVRAALAPVAHELGGHQPELAIGSSGTISTLATMAAAARGKSLRQTNGATLKAEELEALVDQIVSADPGERKQLDGLDSKRVDIITAGALLLSEVFAAFEISELTVSDYALREGVLLSRLGGPESAGVKRLSDLRRSNVERLAKQLDPDPAHGKHTAMLACQLFDRLTSAHGFGQRERELLEWAALLHNVGLFISHSSHHKHSYYVIVNSEHITGFPEREIELIALVARYHRKSSPSRSKHPDFSRLAPEDQQLVRILAGILRLAIGLDRSYNGAVTAVRVFAGPEELIVEPIAGPECDLDLEIYAANERSQLLSNALDLEVKVRRPEEAVESHSSS